MKVTFSGQFEKQLDNILETAAKIAIRNAVQKIITASSLREIANLKKMKGHKTAYWLRTGDYRIGFYFENGGAHIVAVAHRKEIYRHFP